MNRPSKVQRFGPRHALQSALPQSPPEVGNRLRRDQSFLWSLGVSLVKVGPYRQVQGIGTPKVTVEKVCQIVRGYSVEDGHRVSKHTVGSEKDLNSSPNLSEKISCGNIKSQSQGRCRRRESEASALYFADRKFRKVGIPQEGSGETSCRKRLRVRGTPQSSLWVSLQDSESASGFQNRTSQLCTRKRWASLCGNHHWKCHV